MKHPASQYYWGDWRRDTALQGCSLTARGLWHEMNCLMHDCEPYGHLSVNGNPMPVDKLARLVGTTAKECRALLDELGDAGVFSKTSDGMIFSRRMVRDETLREVRAETGRQNGSKGAAFGSLGAEHGKKGGRPRGENPGTNGGNEPGQKPPQNPHPAFASAFASAIQPPNPRERGSRRSGSVHPFPPGFEAFWSAYPRKTAKDSAAKAFAKLGAVDDALLARMLAAIERQKATPQWEKDGGQFVPHPATWLNGRRWEDETGAPSSNGSAIPDAAETATRLAAERAHDEIARSPEAHAARRRAMEQIHGVAAALTRTKR